MHSQAPRGDAVRCGLFIGQLVQPLAPAASHVTQEESHAPHELDDDSKWARGHAAMHAPLWRNGAIDGHDRQLLEEPPLHVAQLASQAWQTLLESAYLPSPHAETQLEPNLYGVPDAHVVQSAAVPDAHVPQVE